MLEKANAIAIKTQSFLVFFLLMHFHNPLNSEANLKLISFTRISSHPFPNLLSVKANFFFFLIYAWNGNELKGVFGYTTLPCILSLSFLVLLLKFSHF